MIKVKSICSLAVLVFAVCFLCGCNTTTPNRYMAKYEKDATKEYEKIKKGSYPDLVPYTTLRDFEIKGVIFVESKVTIDVNGERNGSEITNYMLMKEAQKLGGDDVVNIKIDEKEESEVVDGYDSKLKFLKRKYKKISYIYHATALAIKYTDAIMPNNDNVPKVTNVQIEASIKKDIEKKDIVKKDIEKKDVEKKEELAKPEKKTRYHYKPKK